MPGCRAPRVLGRAPLLAAGLDDGQVTFDEAAARLGLRALRGAPPKHRLPEGALGSVIGVSSPATRFDAATSPVI
jgi:hypothetical protein